MVSLSFDIDWAPDPVIRDTRRLLEDFGVVATFFSTHDDGVVLSNHERALHPNFLRENETEDETLNKLTKVFPEAKGVRSHSLYTHGGIFPKFEKIGLRYTSNYLLYGQSDLHPFWLSKQLVEVPIFFMDDTWLRSGGGELDIDSLIDSPGELVFAFHPIHIYLNSPSIDFYEEHKDHYQDLGKLTSVRYEGSGVRTLLKSLLEALERRNEEVCTVWNLADRYRSNTQFGRIP
jgi:hypothetical protein